MTDNHASDGTTQFAFTSVCMDERPEFFPACLQLQMDFGVACQVLNQLVSQLWGAAMLEKEYGPHAAIKVSIVGSMDIKKTDTKMVCPPAKHTFVANEPRSGGFFHFWSLPMNFLPHIAARLIGTPLMVEHAKLETILSVVASRIDIEATGLSAEVPPAAGAADLVVTPGGIAVVPIHGTLVKRVGALDAASGLTSYAGLEEMILDAATDPAVRAILLDIDSPGGEVGGVFDLANLIREAGANKPVWAVADDAFSAAYLLASAAHCIYLPQTAGVGSVGVIAVHVDESQRDAREGRKYTTVFAGSRKNDFSSHTPLSDDAHRRLQGEVDRLYSMFVSTVAANRNITEASVRATEAGLYFGANALVAGLADRVGTIREAIADLAGIVSSTRTTATITHQKEFRMEQPTPVAEAATPSRTTFQQEAQAIVDLCALANMPQLAGEYIANGMSEAQVRQELMARRASGPEIHSHIMPMNATQASVNVDNSPVVAACKKMAQQHHAMGGV